MIADPKRKPHQDDGDSDKRRRQEQALDEALENTFPASDPVSVEQPMASSAQRYSIATARFSVQPSSRCTNAAVHSKRVVRSKKLMIGTLPSCCARAANGHAAAAPPSSDMNLRRFTR
jgi:hypothetical protein